MRNYTLVFILVFLVVFTSCKKDEKNLKFDNSDLFSKTIVKSQFFNIDLSKDTTIVGNKGTKVVIPRNSFTLQNGQPIRNIKFELSEALTLDDMILSNLTTTSNGKLLETDGMIYINATYKGDNLIIDNDKPLYIEIPTKNIKPNMMVYKGVRDSIGNINWIEPKKLKQYLIPVDLELLDFLPEGFEQVAINYLSYYKKPLTKKSIDSLYYSLSIEDVKEQPSDALLECGITPSEIQTIKSPKFNNTLIATKEFETRLPYLFKTCNDENLRMYVMNLNKNMWEVDSLVLENLYQKTPITQIRTEEFQVNISGGLTIHRERRVLDTIAYISLETIKNQFLKFKNQRLTNVEHKSVYINQLANFYNSKLKENIKKTDSLRAIALVKKQNSPLRVVYRKLLKEREKIAMQSYGFKQTETGWINIDNGVIPKDWNYQKVNVKVENTVDFDQTHAYLVFSNTKSIVKLNELDKSHFEINNFKESIPITKNKKITTVVIAIKNDYYYFGKQEFTSSKLNIDTNVSLSLKKYSITKIKELVSRLETTTESNNILNDFVLAVEIKKQEILKEELIKAAFPCCNN